MSDKSRKREGDLTYVRLWYAESKGERTLALPSLESSCEQPSPRGRAERFPDESIICHEQDEKYLF